MQRARNEAPHLAKHTLLEYFHCAPSVISNLTLFRDIFTHTVHEQNFLIIDDIFHTNHSYGLSGTIITADFDINIHSWPEKNFVTVDVFMSETGLDVRRLTRSIKQRLKSSRYLTIELKRGLEKERNKPGEEPEIILP